MRWFGPWGKAMLIPLLVISLWQFIGSADTGILPTPSQVGHSAVRLLATGDLWRHLSISMSRVLLGFGGATLAGLPLGILLGWLPLVRPWVDPTIQFLRQIPPVAWIPLFILWLGTGETSKVAVIFLAAVFPILLNTVLGVQQIPRDLWEVTRLYRFSPQKTLWRLVLPGSGPAIVSGLRLGMGMSWRALVAAEMLAASSGLGYMVMSSRFLVRMDDMITGIVTIGLFGVAIDRVFVWAEQKLFPWHQAVTGVGRSTHGTTTASIRKGG